MRYYLLLLSILGVWRITHLLVEEDGPWDLVVRAREGLGNGFWGRLLDCFYCLSLWLAAPFALLVGEGWGDRALHWPAISAGAILLERLTSQRGEPPLPAYHEESEIMEDDDGLLRRTETTTASDRPGAGG